MGQAAAVCEATDSEDEIEELTLHWIKQNTMLCRVSGNWVERSEGCDHMECLCGHQFCNRCGEAYVASYSTRQAKSQVTNSSILSHIQEVEQKYPSDDGVRVFWRINPTTLSRVRTNILSVFLQPFPT